MATRKTEVSRPAWIGNLPRAYWKTLEEAEQLPDTPDDSDDTEEASALEHFEAFQRRQESLKARASSTPVTSYRNANLQDANRRYTTLYDRRKTDRRTPAASAGFSVNRRKSAERRAMPPQISLFRHAGLRDNLQLEENIPLAYSPAVVPEAPDESIRIEGLAYPVTIRGNLMQIGTATLTLAEWAIISDNVILDNYGRNLLNFWRGHRETLLNMAREKVTS